MTAYQKPQLSSAEITAILDKTLGSGATGINPLNGGNLSSVYSFVHAGTDYVIKFSEMEGAYKTEKYVSDLLARYAIPYPLCIAQREQGDLAYLISRKIEGHNLGDCSIAEQTNQLPELIEMVAKLAAVDVRESHGYGWIASDGNGRYDNWTSFVVAFNAEDQTGTFWENWHDLYRNSCLEEDVFQEIYARLLAYTPYNEPHRGFIHGDFHQWNILSDGRQITGVIDGNFMYGDPLVDLAILDRHMPTGDIVQGYLDYQEKQGVTIPHFKERLLGAYYFKGLDGLRFYAKMGWQDAYKGTRAFLLNLRD